MSLEEFLSKCSLDGYGHLIVPIDLFLALSGVIPPLLQKEEKEWKQIDNKPGNTG